MERTMKLFSVLALMIVGILAFSGIASAVPASISEVRVDGTEITPGMMLNIVRGEDIDVVVEVNSGDEEVCINENEDLCKVQIEARIRGYDHDDLIDDITKVFEMKKTNTTYVKTLNLKIPQRIDIEDDDEYTIVVEAISNKGVFDYLTENVHLAISSERHQLAIKDIVLNPEREIRAGRALLGTVRIKNYGEKDEEGIKVKMSIPELGVSASDYIDELESDESTTSEELYMRISDCADAGTYQVKVEVEYDDGDEVIKDFTTINVVEGDTCPAVAAVTAPRTIVTVGVDTQDVAAGAGVVYPLTITNSGTASKAYTVSVDGAADWANVRVSPSNTVVLQPGETTSIFVYVATKENAAPGLHMIVLSISSDGEVVKQVPLKANVTSAAEVSGIGGLKKGLEIGLVVLVILLVILGLIIGFSKLRGEPEEESKTYY